MTLCLEARGPFMCAEHVTPGAYANVHVKWITSRIITSEIGTANARLEALLHMYLELGRPGVSIRSVTPGGEPVLSQSLTVEV